MINLFSPVSSIKTANPVRISPNEHLDVAWSIFKKFNIHHIPVEAEGRLVGIVSKSDVCFYHKLVDKAEILGLTDFKISDFMTEGVAKLESSDRIIVAIDLFKMNSFSALPVVDNNITVGIVTTYDIINILDSHSAELSSYSR